MASIAPLTPAGGGPSPQRRRAGGVEWAVLLLPASPRLTRGLGLAERDAGASPCASLLCGRGSLPARPWPAPSARPCTRCGDAEAGKPSVCAAIVWLRVSRSSLSLAGHTPAEAGGLEASLVTRASRKGTGWLVWRLAGIPSRAAAPMAALFPVAIAQRATPTPATSPPATRGRRARSRSAERARRNMVAH